MKRIQELQKAKSFLEMLMHSIDPTTQEAITDSILTKKEIQDTFLYVSSILDELIKNNGEVIQVNKPIEFQVEKINKRVIYLSSEAISIQTLVNRINHQVDKDFMKTLKPAQINNWLIHMGFIKKETEKRIVERQESVYFISDQAEAIGLQYKIDLETGEAKHNSVLLSRQAQEFIIDHLESIVGVEKDGESNI